MKIKVKVYILLGEIEIIKFFKEIQIRSKM